MLTFHLLLCLLVAVANAQTPPGANDTDCGRRGVRELTLDGESVKSEQPWRIIIYLRDSATSTDWSFRATGTLISTKHVVTDAYRFTNDASSPLPADLLRLNAGEHLHDYDSTEPNTQTRAVESVHIHDQYNDTNRHNNIALLVADRPFTLTADVNMACLAWSGLMLEPTQGQHAIGTGLKLGVNIIGSVYASQPHHIFAHTECQSSAMTDRRPYFSTDNVCARTTSTYTCTSVWGSGLMVERPTDRGARYYLVGLLRRALEFSESEGCNYNILSAFTTVMSSWLKGHVNSTDPV